MHHRLGRHARGFRVPGGRLVPRADRGAQRQRHLQDARLQRSLAARQRPVVGRAPDSLDGFLQRGAPASTDQDHGCDRRAGVPGRLRRREPHRARHRKQRPGRRRSRHERQHPAQELCTGLWRYDAGTRQVLEHSEQRHDLRRIFGHADRHALQPSACRPGQCANGERQRPDRQSAVGTESRSVHVVLRRQLEPEHTGPASFGRTRRSRSAATCTASVASTSTTPRS